MKRFLPLLFTVTLFLCGSSVPAQETIQIGGMVNTSNYLSYLPSYAYYGYGYSQQIYLASEIGMAGTITDITFYYGNTTATRNYSVYLQHTAKSSFSSSSDRVATEGTPVFSGTVSITTATGGTNIHLQTPFEYNGTDNLLLIVDDNTGGWDSPYPWSYVHTSDAYRAIYGYHDSYNYNPAGTAWSGNAGWDLNVNTIKLTIMPQQSGNTTTVTIGSGGNTNSRLPSYTGNRYSLSEQIYLAEEIGQTGDIVSISYYDDNNYTDTRSVNLYMMQTDLNSFASTSDYVEPASADLVFSGNVTFQNGRVTITLDEPFFYNGNGNLLVAFYDHTGSSTNTHNFHVYPTNESRAFQASDYSAISFQTPQGSQLLSSINQIQLEIGEHEVAIGSGGSYSENLPTNTCFKYFLSEQIYLAEEIGSGSAANIGSISFDITHAESGANNNRHWTIYLKNVGSQTGFADNHAWLDLSDATQVYNGTVNCRQEGRVTIPFDEFYYFNGTDNVAVIVDDNTGSYVCTNKWETGSAQTNAALYYYDDMTNPSAGSPGITGTLLSQRNRVCFGLNFPEVLPEPALTAPVIMSSSGVSIPCGGTATLTASGVVSDNGFPIRYLWYADPDGLVLLHEGPTFELENVVADRTVYVRATNYVNAETEEFSYTGSEQTYEVPAGVTQVRLEVWGAQGGSYGSSYSGGKGGYSAGTLQVNGGDKLYVYVGGQGSDSYTTAPAGTNPGGWNGGGDGKNTEWLSSWYGSGPVGHTYALGGGGGTDIRAGGNELRDRVIVAGGGSGCNYYEYGYRNWYYYSLDNVGGNNGRYGGGSTGGGWYSSYQGGQQAAGTGGGFGQGANSDQNSSYVFHSAGGGGGWFGGGSSGGSDDDVSITRQMGGGSGYVNTASSYHPSGYRRNSSEYYLSNTVLQAGNISFTAPSGSTETGHPGNGFARITPAVPETYSISEMVSINILSSEPRAPEFIEPAVCEGEPTTVRINHPVSGLTYGWFTTPDCTGEPEYEGTEYTLEITSPVTLYVCSYHGTLRTPVQGNFSYTGSEQTYEVPAGVRQVRLEVWGAQGGSYGSYSGGRGGYSAGTLQVNEGDKLYVYVGGRGSDTYSYSSDGTNPGGWNGGGNGKTYYWSSTYTYALGGGGGTDIRAGGNTRNDRVIVAGGGSGASNRGAGWWGGGNIGGGYSSSYQATQQAAGLNGSFGQGAHATASYNYRYGPAGGGGGWWGGGSNSTSSDNDAGYARYTGGGSGYVNTASSFHPSEYRCNSPRYYLSNTVLQAGNTSFTAPSGGSETGHPGNGFARITPNIPPAPSCMSDIVSITLTPHPVPNVTLTAGQYTACNRETITLTATDIAGVTYSWSEGVTGSGRFGTVRPGVTTTYTVSATNEFGCAGTDSVTISVDAPHLIITSSTEGCINSGEEVHLHVIATAESAPHVEQYVFTSSTGTWTDISHATDLSGSITLGDYGSGTVYLPFSFNYCGHVSSQIYFSTGTGYLQFANNSNYRWDLFSVDFWATGIHSKTEGSAPNRIFTMQLDGYVYGHAQEPLSLQVKLHEGTNVLDFVYGPGFTSLTYGSPVINIRGPLYNNILNVVPTGAGTASTSISSSSTSLTVENVNHIVSGTVYTFTPGATNATFVWNTGVNGPDFVTSPLETTPYTVTVSAPGYACDAVQTYKVKVNPTLELSATPPTVCSGSTATVTVSGADSYLWNTNATVDEFETPALTTSTTYMVTGTTVDGCFAVSSITVSVPPFTAGDVSGSGTVCQSQATPYIIPVVAAGAGGGETEYRWFRDGSTTPLENSNSNEYAIPASEINGLSVGTHTYRREFRDDCGHSWTSSTGEYVLTVEEGLQGIEVAGNTVGVPCGGTATLTAGGVPGDYIVYCWYADAEATQLIDTGTTFTPGIIAGDTTFYLLARDFSQIVYHADTVDFSYTGSEQTYEVPAGVTQVRLEVWGAQGGSYGSYSGGKGGYSAGTLQVNEGDKLYVYVGGQGSNVYSTSSGGINYGGWNGGGNGKTYNWNYYTYALGGGGGTDIRAGGHTYNDRVIVAGGGSGASNRGAGWYGGGSTGGAYNSTYQATQQAAGTGGSFGQGAHATASNVYNYGPAGGGGGWWGGGSGTSSDSDVGRTRYTGGGSGYVNMASSFHPSDYRRNSSEYYLSNTVLQAGNTSFTAPSGGSETGHPGNGFARIIYTTATRVEGGCPSAVLPVTLESLSPATPSVEEIPASCEGQDLTLSIHNPFPALTYGWFTTPDCTGEPVYEGTEYTMPATATTLYVRSYVKATETVEITDFSCTGGEQIYEVPSGVEAVRLEVWGARGATYSDAVYPGGRGGYSAGTLQVNEGDRLYVYVGGHGEDVAHMNAQATNPGGWNGGGNGMTYSWSGTSTYALGGGGGTDIRAGGNELRDRVIVAGGGSGASNRGKGWWGGGSTGGAYNSSYQATQQAAGMGGSFGQGANSGGSYNCRYGPAAGGGGWYGGGSSNTANDSYDYYARYAGGGSGYVNTASSFHPSGYRRNSPRYYLSDTILRAGNTSFPSPSGDTETGHYDHGFARITALKKTEGCLSDIITVVIPEPHPVPNVTLTADSYTACHRETITLTATDIAGVTYSWSEGVTGSGRFGTVRPGITTTYTVSATNEFGCAGTADVTISVDAPPIAINTPETSCVNPNDSIILTVSGTPGIAANCSEYEFDDTPGSYEFLSGGNYLSSGDDASSAVNIGFTFNYCGTDYTTATLSSNGYLRFGSGDIYTNSLGNADYYNYVAAFWDDLYATELKYATSGTEPNRVFTMQFSGYRYGQGSYPFSFQIKLYETSNKIAIHYGSGFTNLAGVSNISASIGLTDNVGNGHHFLSVTPNGYTQGTTSTTLSNDNIDGITATLLTPGTVYTFSPGELSNIVWSTGETTENIKVAPNATTTYTVTVSHVNYECDAVVSQTITVKPVIEVIPNYAAVCSGTPITLTASGAESYVWCSVQPVENENGYYVYNSLSTDDSYTTPALTTETTYYIVGMSEDGCYNMRSVTVYVPDFSPGSISGELRVCQSETTPITITGVDGTGGGETEYRWYRNNVELASSNINNYVITADELASLQAGEYNYTRKYKDACGNDWAWSAGEYKLIVDGGLAQPQIGGNTAISCGESTELIASGVVSEFSNPIIYRWYSDPEGHNLVYEGSVFNTPSLTENTTYYVQAIDSGNTVMTTDIPYSGGVSTYSIPAGAASLKLEVWGAQGGTYSGYSGGKGGYSVGTLTVPPGLTALYVYVGGVGGTSYTSGGFNGGGKSNSYGAAGGGSTDISTQMVASIYSTTHYNSRIIVAGGGGGVGYNGRSGGYGGGLTGGKGENGTNLGGYGGSQTGGGSNNAAGTFGSANRDNTNNGGGGGGGWYGGASGSSGGTDAAGGGGSGYVYTASTAGNYPSGCMLNSSYYLTNASTHAGNTSFTAPSGGTETGHSGNGFARITATIHSEASCPSILKAVPVTVATPQSPVIRITEGSGNIVCGGQVTLEVQNPGNNLEYRWSTDPEGTNVVYTGSSYSPLLTDDVTYYVKSIMAVSGTCESPMSLPVSITVSEPEAPEVETHSITCGEDVVLEVQNADAGLVYNWYDDEACTRMVYTGSSWTLRYLAGDTVFYVKSYAVDRTSVPGDAHNVVYCSSPASRVEVTVNALAAPELRDTTISCGTEMISLAIENVQPGIVYNWYYDNAATDVLATNRTSFDLPVVYRDTSFYVRGFGVRRPAVTEVETYSYTGAAENFIVPGGVDSVTLEVWGADGGTYGSGGGAGGKGGYSVGTLAVTPGQELLLYVGGAGGGTHSPGGFNGGGNANNYGGGGGGATDVRVGGNSLYHRVIVAGGGGGGGYGNNTGGGTGGGLTGGNGTGGGGYGGSQTGGGSNNAAGTFGSANRNHSNNGGGGGGGWYGGASGEGSNNLPANTITVGIGTNDWYFTGWYHSESHAMKYDAYELGNQNTAITINSIAFYITSITSNSYVVTYEVWLKAVPNNYYYNSSTSFSTFCSGATKIYGPASGTMTQAGTWNAFNCSTPFTLPAGQSLMVMVKAVSSSSSGSVAHRVRHTDVPNNHWYSRFDGTATPYPSTDEKRPNIRLSCSVPDMAGGGGSGYVYTESTAGNYPDGCMLNSDNYLTNARTLAGNASFPAPTDVAGNTVNTGGNGFIRLTYHVSGDYVCRTEIARVQITSTPIHPLTSGMVYLSDNDGNEIENDVYEGLPGICDGEEILFYAYDDGSAEVDMSNYNVMWFDENHSYLGYSSMDEVFHSETSRNDISGFSQYTFHALAAVGLLSERGQKTTRLNPPTAGHYSQGVIFSVTARDNMTIDSLAFYPNGSMQNASTYVYYRFGKCSDAASDYAGWHLDGNAVKMLNLTGGVQTRFPLSDTLTLLPGKTVSFLIYPRGTNVQVRRESGISVDDDYAISEDRFMTVNCGYGVNNVSVQSATNGIQYQLLTSSELEQARLFSGSITYTLNGNTQFGCVAKDTLPIDFLVWEPPVAIDSIKVIDTVICVGDEVTLTADGGSPGGRGDLPYTWREGSCDESSVLAETTTPDLTISPTTTTTYYVNFVSDVCGATECASKTIYVYDKPELQNLQHPEYICAGTPFNMEAPGIIAGDVPAPILDRGWEITPHPESEPFTLFTDSLNVSERYNEYYVRYFVHASCDIVYSDTIQIFVDSMPEVERQLTLPPTLCSQDLIDWDAYVPDVIPHSHSGNVNGEWVVFRNDQPVADYPAMELSPGDDLDIQYCAENGCGRTCTPMYHIHVTELPEIMDDIMPATVCAGEPVNIALPRVDWKTDSSDAYWEYASAIGASNFTRLDITAPVEYGMDNNIFRYIAKNSCGSDTSNEVQLAVNDVPHIDDIPVFETICSGTELNIDEPQISDFCGLDTTGRSWYLADSELAQDDAWQAVSDTVYADDFDGHTAWNGRWLRYGATNACGTGYSNAVEVSVHPDLHLTVSPAESEGCYGPDYTLTAACDAGMTDVNYSWSCTPGGNLPPDAQGNSVTAEKPAPGTNIYTVVATDLTTQCEATATAQLEITAIVKDTAVMVCAEELPYYYDLVEHPESAFDESGTYLIDYVTDEECDSIVALHLIVNEPTEYYTHRHYCAYPAVGYTWPITGLTYGNIHDRDTVYFDTVHVSSTTVRSDVTGGYCDSIVYYLEVEISNEPFITHVNDITVPVRQTATADITVDMHCEECIARSAIRYQLYKDDEPIGVDGMPGYVYLETYYPDQDYSYGIRLENGGGEIPGSTYNMYNYQYDFFYMQFLRNAPSTLSAIWYEPGEYRMELKLVRKTWSTGWDFPYTMNQEEVIGGAGSRTTDTVFAVENIVFHVVDDVDTAEMTDTSICARELADYRFYGEAFDSGGTYYAFTDNGDGSYTMHGLTLNVIEPDYGEVSVSTCETSYMWPASGVTYIADGDYTCTLTSTVTGCDSIVTLHLTLNAGSNFTRTENVTACDSYEFNGHMLTESGTYIDTLVVTGDACDTTFNVINLTVNHSVDADTTIQVTEIQLPYTFDGYTFETTGNYDIIYQSATGCDSILHLTLEPVTVGIGITENEISTHAGDYTIRIDGGTLNNTRVSLDYEVICDGEIINNVRDYANMFFETEYARVNTWFGRDLTNGTGSIPANTFRITFYQFDYFYLNFLNQAQHHLAVNWNRPGDYKIRFKLRKREGGHDFPMIYDEEEHRVGGGGASGSDILCMDSIEFHYDAEQVVLNVKDTICSSELPYHYRDSLFTEEVTDSVLHFRDAYHVHDTMVTLTLHINPSYNDTISRAICAETDYNSNGFNLTAEEIAAAMHNNTAQNNNEVNFTRYYTTVNGCDSIITLQLHIYDNPDVTLQDRDHISLHNYCEGIPITMIAENADTYLWEARGRNTIPQFPTGETRENTQSFTATDSCMIFVTGYRYYDTLRCSTTREYEIMVNRIGHTDTVFGDVCMGERWSNDYFDITPEMTAEAGILDTTRMIRESDCGDDSIHLVLTIHQVYNGNFNSMVEVEDVVCEGIPYQGNGFTLTAEEIAGAVDENHTARFFHSVETANGCDSTTMLTLQLIPMSRLDTTIHVCENMNAAIFGSDADSHSFPVENATHEIRYPAANGCDSIVYVHVVVDSIPEVEIVGNSAVCAGHDLSLEAEITTSMDSLTWSIGSPENVISTSQRLYIGANDTANMNDTPILLSVYNGVCTDMQRIPITIVSPEVHLDTTICSYETFIAPDNARYDEQLAAYTWTAPAMNNDECDTTFFMSLRIAPLQGRIIDADISVAELPYICYGEEYYEAGEYTIYVPCNAVCDSVITLRLNVIYPEGTNGNPFMTVTEGEETDSHVLQAYYGEQGDPEKKVSIDYHLYKNGNLVDIIADECGGTLEIGTEYSGSLYSRSLYNGTGSIPTNTFILGNNAFDYFYFYFLNGRDNVITHHFTEPGEYVIVFELISEEGGVDFASRFNYRGQLRLIGGKNSTGGEVLATAQASFRVDGTSSGGEIVEGTPILNLSENRISEQNSTVELTCDANDMEGTVKTAIRYTIYANGQPITYLSDFASRVEFSTWWPYQNRYVGKAVTSAAGTIPANTFAPTNSYIYNYFYMNFMANTQHRIQVMWRHPGNYKIVFDLIKMDGGVDFPLTWNGTDRIGGKSATQSGVLATQTLYYNISDVPEVNAAAAITENDDSNTPLSLSLFPNPTKSYTMLTMTQVTENTVVTVTDVNGKLMARYLPTDPQLKIAIDGWAQGVYFVTVCDGTNVETRKLIISK